MASPIAITQSGPGASGYDDNIAVGTFTQGAGVEDNLFIHIGFVPKVFILKNISEGQNSIPAAMWINTMPAVFGTTYSYVNLDTGVFVTGAANGFIGWDSSVTCSPPAAQGGTDPGTAYWGVVPVGFYYIKEGVATLSGGFVQDKIIGIKIVSTTGVGALLGLAGEVFHYVAIG